MPFVKMPGVTGKVYVPDPQPDHLKKHRCPDCFSCQRCSDDRCRICRGKTREDKKKDEEADSVCMLGKKDVPADGGSCVLSSGES